MADSKIYLNVPYAHKDTAKALGARWDAVNKKWYVPANIDIVPFAKWRPGTVASESPSTTMSGPRVRASSSKISSSDINAAVGVITHPEDKEFVAYNGDEPPWD